MRIELRYLHSIRLKPKKAWWATKIIRRRSVPRLGDVIEWRHYEVVIRALVWDAVEETYHAIVECTGSNGKCFTKRNGWILDHPLPTKRK